MEVIIEITSQYQLFIAKSKILHCYIDLYTVSNGDVRGEYDDDTGEKVCRKGQSGFQTQTRRLQKSKTGNQWPGKEN